MPNVFSPSSASPESLRRMRLKAGFLLPGMVTGLSVLPAPLGAAPGPAMLPHQCDVRLRLGRRARFLAHLEAGEPAHHDILLDEGDLLLDELADSLVRLADEGLLEQADLGEVLLELALRDLVPDGLGLARLGGLRLVDLALL